jgi:hypothetical protein
MENVTLEPGATLNVAFTATDLDNDTLIALAASSDEDVVTAAITDPGVVLLTAMDQTGTATITVTVDDGRGETVSTTFDVTVEAANQNPTIDAIAPIQLAIGETQDVPFNATDPDGDPLTTVAFSDSDGVASAVINTAGIVTVTANGEGTANITINVDDGRSGTTSAILAVTVEAANQNPTIDALAPIQLAIGDTQDVPFNATDPDGDPLTTIATSNSDGVASAAINTAGVVTVTANGEGTANITINVDDGRGGTTSAILAVTVEAANQNPTIDAIAPIQLAVGETQDVPFNATDPDSDPLTTVAFSDNEGVASAATNTAGVVSVTANGEGTANITINVDDGRGGTTSAILAVTVEAANQNPTIDALAPIQLAIGETQDVPFNATDPDGDPLTTVAFSDNDRIASAAINTAGVVTVTGNSAGTANITVNVDDGRGGTTSTFFTITVEAVNQNPTIDAIAPIQLGVGETQDVPFNATDPDSDPLTTVAFSDNDGSVSAVINTAGVVTITANTEGTANITINVDDGRGGTTSTTFTVDVLAPAEPTPEPPTDQINLADVPNVSPVEDEVLTTTQEVYQQYQANAGVFSVAGDLPPEEFMYDLGDGTANFADIGDAQALNEEVFYFTSTPLTEGGNSFTQGGLYSTNHDWTAADLLDPTLSDPTVCAGQSPLDCELTQHAPVVMFISIGRNDVTNNTPTDEFAQDLDTIINTVTSYGTIPVLMTIPGDPAMYPTLPDFNQIIVDAATTYNLPLINVANVVNTTNPTSINADLSLAAPPTLDDFSPELRQQYGSLLREILALRILNQLRINVPIP